ELRQLSPSDEAEAVHAASKRRFVVERRDPEQADDDDRSPGGGPQPRRAPGLDGPRDACAGEEADERPDLDVVVAPCRRTEHAEKQQVETERDGDESERGIPPGRPRDVPESEQAERPEHVQQRRDVAGFRASRVDALQKVKEKGLEDERLAITPV